MVMQQCFFWEGGGGGGGGVFFFNPPPPPPPRISVIFQLDQEPPGKNSYINNACALY